MNKKKSGLSKKISSIFQDVPDLKDDRAGPETPKSSAGRNALIPLEKSFCRFWGRKRLLARRGRSVLDIGSSAIKWICLEEVDRGRLKLVGVAHILIPPVQDGRKYFENLTVLVKQLKNEARFVKDVDLLISEPTAIFSSHSIPRVHRKRMVEVLSAEIFRRNPSWNREDTLMNFYVSDRPSREKVGALHVTVAQAKEDELEGWVQAVERGGWGVRRMGGIPFAIEKILKEAALTDSEEVAAVLEIGAVHTTIFFYRSGILEYQRGIPMAFGELTKVLQRPIIGIEEKIELTQEEAEELKMSHGIPYGEGEIRTIQGKVVTHAQILGFIRPILERFVQEVERSISFYLRTYQVSACRKLFVTGGGAQLPNLMRFLSESLKLGKIEFLSPFGKLGIEAQDIDLEKFESVLGPSLGLALLDQVKLDLRPREIRRLVRLRRFRFVFNWAAGFLLGVLGILFAFDLLQSRDHEKWFNRTYGDFLKAKTAMTRLEFLRSQRDQLQETSRSYRQVVGNYPSWEYLLKELSRAVLEQVFLSSLALTYDENEWSLRMKGKVLPGVDSVEHALSEFLIRLEDSNSLTDAHLASSQRMGESVNEGIEFELKCHVRVAGGSDV